MYLLSGNSGYAFYTLADPNFIPPPVGDAPVFGDDVSVDVLELTTFVGNFAAVSGTAPINYTLEGPDASRFVVGSSTGNLAFIVAPDYESPTDIGANNVYNVNIVATNLFGATSRSIVVNVQDVVGESPPVLGAGTSVNITEGASIVGNFPAVGDAPIVYSLTGVDAARFLINVNTGLVTFNTLPIWSSPTDSNGDNVYLFTVNATNSEGSDTQDVSVTVLRAQQVTQQSGTALRQSSINVRIVTRLKNLI
jgi:hypothetical protein